MNNGQKDVALRGGNRGKEQMKERDAKKRLNDGEAKTGR